MEHYGMREGVGVIHLLKIIMFTSDSSDLDIIGPHVSNQLAKRTMQVRIE